MDAQELDQTPEATEPATTIDIPPAEPANDNAGDEGAPAAGEPKQTRQQRKGERLRVIQDTQARAERAERALEEERRQRAAELGEVRGRLAAFEEAQRRAQQQGDPYEKQIQEAQETAWKKLQDAAASQDPARSAAMMREYHQALTQAAALQAKRETAQQMEQFRKSMPDPQQTRTWSQLTGEFDWLENNHAARQMADGYVGWLVNTKGRQPGLATFREACAMAAKEFGLGGADAGPPSNARRAAYGGVPSRSGAAGDDERDSLDVPPGEDAALKRMAEKAFSNLEPKEAWKMFRQKILPGLKQK